MKKVIIKTTNIFKEEITLTGFVKEEDLSTKDSLCLYEEESDEDFFIIHKSQISEIF